MVREVEIQPVKQNRTGGWTQCTEREATGYYVAVWPDRRLDRQFTSRKEASTYRDSLI
jgi:hypothetical protein